MSLCLKLFRMSDGNTSFLRAARNGQLDKVLEHLKSNIDINTSNANGLNALHLASKDGHVEIVEELLKRGAVVDAATKKGNTALHIASLAGQEEVVKLLVQHGASVNVQSQNGFTPLYMAAQENHDNVVKYLLSNGANQSLSTEDGFTPLAVAMQQGHDKVVTVLLENDTRGKVRLPALHIAAKKDDVKAAKLLLENEHNPDVTSKSGFTPLHIASHYGNQQIANLLIQKGADVNYSAKHNITPLHVAAKWGKTNMVATLVDNGATIESKTRDGLTPLHCAARSGHEQVVDMLLERGAPISSKTKNGLAPLHMAAQGDHVDAARILLYHRAPVDEVTVDYLTALHVAAHCGHVRVAKLLLDRQADANARALNGFTPLHIACKKNRIKVVELLLKHGASIGATTESGLTPLHVASFMGCMNIVIYLLQHDASPDVPTVRGETPLHLAARANQTDIIRILLRNGAQVDARAREQQTPLHIASRLGNVDIVMLLLQHGAKVDNTTKDMYSALHIAAKEGQDEVAAVLIENGATLDATTKKGFTPLHLAAKYGHLKVAKLLLQKEAPVDAQGKNGVTPLHVASHYDHQNVALLLLDKGASPHATAKNGHTPLHTAARKNQMDIANTLLEYGAQPNAESKAGFTPLHLSSQEGHTDMTSLLLEHKADANHQAKNGLTPLHLCAQEDRVPAAEILVKNGAVVDTPTKAGYTPLHVACHFGQVNMVRYLLANGAKVDASTSLGYTPLHQAAQQGHTNIVNLLLENNADPNAVTNNGQTPLNIANKLGYITVIETLKVVTTTTSIITNTTTNIEEKYRVVAPEAMHETFMSDSEEEGGEDTLLGDQTYRYLTADEMKSLGDDSLPIDVTRDERIDSNRMVISGDSNMLPPQNIEDNISPEHVTQNYVEYIKKYQPDNVDIGRHPINIGKLHWKNFLVSFLVDARGGAMRGCRHSGVRVIVPPRCAPSPTRITCRYVRPQRTPHPPPLMEGEALASRVLELGPVGAKFLGPVIIEVPHFAALRGKEREIVILRSDNGENWKEHTVEATEEVVNEVLNESFEAEDLSQLEDMASGRITRILTQDFPQYFAVVSRVRQEVHAIGPEGGMVSSTVVPQVQAVFPEGALTKKIKVGLQAQPIDPELTAKLLGHGVAVSPVVTVEPRRRKFHKAITLSMPAPRAHSQGMINQYSGSAPTLRLLCSITGGTTRAQWEDVTGSTPLTFVNDCVSFTTTVSARFWLMDCRNIGDATKMATELYKEAIHVPFMAKFVVFAKRIDPLEARLRVFCMTDDKEDKTLEQQEHFTEVAKSRDVEVLEGKPQYIEFAGNLVPITKSGEQLQFSFRAFRENRLPFSVRVKDQHAEAVSRCLFMKEPKVPKGEPPQQPICILNIVLPDDIVSETISLSDTDSVKRHILLSENFDYYRPDPRLADMSNLLGEDWVPLATQLGLTPSEINVIKSEYPDSVAKQGQSMLRMWLSQSGNKAQTNILENALRRIEREDIIPQCLNVDQNGQTITRIKHEEKQIYRLKRDSSLDRDRKVTDKELIPETRETYQVHDKYSAEEKAVAISDEEEDFNKTVTERRQQIENKLSADRTIPASSQRVEIVQEITSIKRQSIVEDKIAEVQKGDIKPSELAKPTTTTITKTTEVILPAEDVSKTTEKIAKTTQSTAVSETIDKSGTHETETTILDTRTTQPHEDTHRTAEDSELLKEVTERFGGKKPMPKLLADEDPKSPHFSKTPPPSPAEFLITQQAATVQAWDADKKPTELQSSKGPLEQDAALQESSCDLLTEAITPLTSADNKNIPQPKPRSAKTPDTQLILSQTTTAQDITQDKQISPVRDDLLDDTDQADNFETYTDKKKFWENISNDQIKKQTIVEETSHVEKEIISIKRKSIHEFETPPVPKPRASFQQSQSVCEGKQEDGKSSSFANRAISLDSTTSDSTDPIHTELTKISGSDTSVVEEKIMTEYQASFLPPAQMVSKTKSRDDDLKTSKIDLEKTDSLDSDRAQRGSSQLVDNVGYISDSEDVEHYISDSEIEDRVPQIRERQMSVFAPPVAPMRKSIYERSASLPTEDLYEVSARNIKLRKQYYEDQIKKEMIEEQLTNDIEDDPSPERKPLYFTTEQVLQEEDEEPKEKDELDNEEICKRSVKDLKHKFEQSIENEVKYSRSIAKPHTDDDTSLTESMQEKHDFESIKEEISDNVMKEQNIKELDSENEPEKETYFESTTNLLEEDNLTERTSVKSLAKTFEKQLGSVIAGQKVDIRTTEKTFKISSKKTVESVPSKLEKESEESLDDAPKTLPKEEPVKDDGTPKTLPKEEPVKDDDAPKTLPKEQPVKDDDAPKTLAKEEPVKDDVAPKTLAKEEPVKDDVAPKTLPKEEPDAIIPIKSTSSQKESAIPSEAELDLTKQELQPIKTAETNDVEIDEQHTDVLERRDDISEFKQVNDSLDIIESDKSQDDLNVTDDIASKLDSMEVHVDKSEIEDSEKLTEVDTDFETKSVDSFVAEQSPKGITSVDEAIPEITVTLSGKQRRISEESDEYANKEELASTKSPPINQPEEHIEETVWEVSVQSETHFDEKVTDIVSNKVGTHEPIDKVIDDDLSTRDESEVVSEVHQDRSDSLSISDKIKSESYSDIEKIILDSLHQQKVDPDEARKIANSLLQEIEAEIQKKETITLDTKIITQEVRKEPVSDYLRQLAEAKGLDEREVELVESVLARRQRELAKLARGDTQASSMEITDEDLRYSGTEMDYSHTLEQQIDQLEAEKVDMKMEYETDDQVRHFQETIKQVDKINEDHIEENYSFKDSEIYDDTKVISQKVASSVVSAESVRGDKCTIKSKDIIFEEDETISESAIEETEKVNIEAKGEVINLVHEKTDDKETDIKEISEASVEKHKDSKSISERTIKESEISHQEITKRDVQSVEGTSQITTHTGETSTTIKTSNIEQNIDTKHDFLHDVKSDKESSIIEEHSVEVKIQPDGSETTVIKENQKELLTQKSNTIVFDHQETKSIVSTVVDDLTESDVKKLMGHDKMDQPEVCQTITHVTIKRTSSSDSKSSIESAKSPEDQLSNQISHKSDPEESRIVEKENIILRKAKSDAESSSSSSQLKGERKSGYEFETYSSSGESHYQSFEIDSGKSRPCSSDIEGLIAAGSSEYESALTSQILSGKSHITSTEYQTAVSSLSSKESMKSLDSESSGNLASIEVSEISETLIPSTSDMDGDILDVAEQQLLEDDKPISDWTISSRPIRQSTEVSDSELLSYPGESMEICDDDDLESKQNIDVQSKMKRSYEMTFQPEPKLLLPESPHTDSVDQDEKLGTSLDEGSVLSMSMSSASSVAVKTVVELSKAEETDMTVSGASEQLSIDEIDNILRSSHENISVLNKSVDMSTSTPAISSDSGIESVTLTTSKIDEDGIQSASTQVTSQTHSPVEEVSIVKEEPKKKGHRRQESNFVASMINITSMPKSDLAKTTDAEIKDNEKCASKLSIKEGKSDEKKDIDESEKDECEFKDSRILDAESDFDADTLDLSRPQSQFSKSDSERPTSTVMSDDRPESELADLFVKSSDATEVSDPIERPISPEPCDETKDDTPEFSSEAQASVGELEQEYSSAIARSHEIYSDTKRHSKELTDLYIMKQPLEKRDSHGKSSSTSSEKSSFDEAEAEAAFSMVAHISPAHKIKQICPILEDEDAEKHELETRERIQKEYDLRRSQMKDQSPGFIPDIKVTQHMTPLVDRNFRYPDLELEAKERELETQMSTPQTPASNSSKSSEETDQGREYILESTVSAIPEEQQDDKAVSESKSEIGTVIETTLKEEDSDKETDSPNSDSFEMLEKPDVLDDFVVIEEVAKEAHEFDSEGKSVKIHQTKKVKSKHDHEVEEYLVKSAPTPLTRMTDIKYYPDGSSSDELGFEFEDSPPQDVKGTTTTTRSSKDYVHEYDRELEANKKWIEQQFQGDQAAMIAAGYGYEMEFERGPLEDIKEEDITDFEGSSRIGSLGSQKESGGSLGSVKDSYSSTPEYDVLAGRKYFTRSGEHDDISMSSLQEFENLEQAMSLEMRRYHNSQDSSSNGSFKNRYHKGQGDDISVSSLKEFEGLEKACIAAHKIEIKVKEEEELLAQIDEGPESITSESESCETISGTQKHATDSDEEDYEKRMFEIDEIIRQAQTNVERFIDLKEIEKTESLGRGDSIEEVSKVPDLDLDAPLVKSTIKVQWKENDDVMVTSTDSLDLKPSSLHGSTDSLDQKTGMDLMTASTDSIEVQAVKSKQDNIMTDSIEIKNEEKSGIISSDSLELGAIATNNVLLTDSIEEDYSKLCPQDISISSTSKDCSARDEFNQDRGDLLDHSITSSTATHATYQYETDSVLSGSFTSGGSNTMVSSTETVDPMHTREFVDVAAAVKKVWFDEDTMGSRFTDYVEDNLKPYVTEVIEPSEDDSYSHTIHRRVELPPEIRKVTFTGSDAQERLKQFIDDFGEGEDVQETTEVDEAGNVHVKRVVQKRYIVKTDDSDKTKPTQELTDSKLGIVTKTLTDSQGSLTTFTQQFDISKTQSSSSSRNVSGEEAAASQPSATDKAESEERQGGSQEHRVADQHQLSEEMKALLKELEKESKQ
ncbi:ankyrin-2-like isoform X3 [Aethina tumida]|uniref:ankyrin-2-like isoform X3 n=1 Tax=Aethina tumida TaxID=116153 RepID=UPI002149421D|nr:ankyrin-2-like isoform X3 [Aethina tumida]